jgi:hypothetical protein
MSAEPHAMHRNEFGRISTVLILQQRRHFPTRALRAIRDGALAATPADASTI